MAEYIERGTGVSIFRAKANMAVLMDAAPYFEKAAQILEKLPAADVAPVVHGLWVEHLDEMECSVCKRQWNYCDNDTNTFNFCPNCGATMDGERKDGDADNG